MLRDLSDRSRSTFQVSKRIGFYPRVRVDTAADRRWCPGRWGAADRDRAPVGLDQALSAGLAPWRKPTGHARSGQDRARSGGDAGAGRGLPGRHRVCCAPSPACSAGRLGSDGVAALIDGLAADRYRALAAINPPERTARRQAWALAGEHAPDHRADAAVP